MPKPWCSFVSGRLIIASLFAAVGMIGCGGTSQGSEPSAGAVARPAPDAERFSAHGMHLSRPEGWVWIAPDGSLTGDTLIVLQGPFGADEVAPAVEISRRPLDARAQRRKPSAILTQVTTEIVQVFDGFEMVGTPADIEVAGLPAAELRLRYTESLPDGQSVSREGRFYGIVHGDSIWIIRCLGAADGSHDPQFDQILTRFTFDA